MQHIPRQSSRNRGHTFPTGERVGPTGPHPSGTTVRSGKGSVTHARGKGPQVRGHGGESGTGREAGTRFSGRPAGGSGESYARGNPSRGGWRWRWASAARAAAEAEGVAACTAVVIAQQTPEAPRAARIARRVWPSPALPGPARPIPVISEVAYSKNCLKRSKF
jgi:hypothetical protein